MLKTLVVPFPENTATPPNTVGIVLVTQLMSDEPACNIWPLVPLGIRMYFVAVVSYAKISPWAFVVECFTVLVSILYVLPDGVLGYCESVIEPPMDERVRFP